MSLWVCLCPRENQAYPSSTTSSTQLRRQVALLGIPIISDRREIVVANHLLQSPNVPAYPGNIVNVEGDIANIIIS